MDSRRLPSELVSHSSPLVSGWRNITQCRAHVSREIEEHFQLDGVSSSPVPAAIKRNFKQVTLGQKWRMETREFLDGKQTYIHNVLCGVVYNKRLTLRSREGKNALFITL